MGSVPMGVFRNATEANRTGIGASIAVMQQREIG
jgi:hypothetical protein